MVTTAAAAGWFLVEQQAALLPPLAIAAVTALAAVMRGQQEGRRDLAHRLAWYACGAAMLAVSWALYFQLLTAGFAADLVARRPVLTLAWLGMGLGFLLRGRRAEAAHVGVGLVGCALIKAGFYDTTHLQGAPRILVLAAVGLLLVGGWAWLGRRGTAGKELV
jgi:hypothetical protein